MKQRGKDNHKLSPKAMYTAGLVLLAVFSSLLLFPFTKNIVIGVFGYAVYAYILGLTALFIGLLIGKKVNIPHIRAIILIALFFSFIITLHIMFCKQLIADGLNTYIFGPFESETVGGVLISLLSLPLMLLSYPYAVLVSFLLAAGLGLAALYPLLLMPKSHKTAPVQEYDEERMAEIPPEEEEKAQEQLPDYVPEYVYPTNPLSSAFGIAPDKAKAEIPKKRKIEEVFGLNEPTHPIRPQPVKDSGIYEDYLERQRKAEAEKEKAERDKTYDFKARLAARRQERAEQEKEFSPVYPSSDFASAADKTREPQEKREHFGFIADEDEDEDDFFAKKPYKAPGIDIFRLHTERGSMPANFEQTRENLERALEELQIPSEVKAATRGPTFTRYELKFTKSNLSIKKLNAKESDLEMRLKAKKVSIIAPIPGTDRFGIDLPNEVRDIVGIRTLLQSQQYAIPRTGIELAIGVTINREPFVLDLVKMPHLLIAGATGSGKSVCINSIIVSIIFKYSPEDVRLLLIDPKRVDLQHFHSLPHMLVKSPVCEPGHAMNALKWLVREMERRYITLRENGVNNINSYNEDVAPFKGVPKMPRIVLIIDELADLMIVNKKVESDIVRLAQLARAAGIHLILATQRPSADVLTRLITSNILCKIAFTVQSHTDSHIILGRRGAEGLLGEGDMLYHSPQVSDAVRLQGVYVSTGEVVEAVRYICENNPAHWDDDIHNSIFSQAEEEDILPAYESMRPQEKKDVKNTEELIKTALEVIIPQGTTSISDIQALLNIGYPKAKKLTTIMEQRGYISGSDSGNKRTVKITMDDFNKLYSD